MTKMIRLTGGHPQDTMLLCSEAYYTLLGEQRLLSETVEIAYERAMLSLAPVFEEILDDIGKNPLVREVLRSLAAEENIYQEKHHPNEIKRVTDQLIVKAVIEKKGRGKYRFVEPMFKEYVLRSY
ncbi:MAG: hypothetical protein AB1500_05480 [Bacillota bacterium]